MIRSARRVLRYYIDRVTRAAPGATMLIAFVEDMIFGSRILASAGLRNQTVELRRGEVCGDPLPAGVRCALIDLDLTAALEIIRSLRAQNPDLRIVAFGPHVQAERLRAARDAGASEALPRSLFVERLPALLDSSNGDGGAPPAAAG